MSHRVMKILETYTPNVEIYSIDEAFLKFEGFDYFDLSATGLKIRKQIRRWTGIPVSVGLALPKPWPKSPIKLLKNLTKEPKEFTISTVMKKD